MQRRAYLSHRPGQPENILTSQQKRERESIDSVQVTHSNIINQSVRAPTTQPSVVSSDGGSEEFAGKLIREMNEHSPHALAKESPMPTRINLVLAQQQQRVSVRVLCNQHTQQRHSTTESGEALFEHWHKGRRPHYQLVSSPIPGKPNTPSRAAVSYSGWPWLL